MSRDYLRRALCKKKQRKSAFQSPVHDTTAQARLSGLCRVSAGQLQVDLLITHDERALKFRLT
jgi:hypothetical protein